MAHRLLFTPVMAAIARENGKPLSTSGRIALGFLALAAVAAPWASGCSRGCPRTGNGATPCVNDHQLLVCQGDPNDQGGQNESSATCPPARPVCQPRSDSQQGECISLTPLMCIEQLVATSTTAGSVAVADLDSDGFGDVVFDDGNELRAALARADGTFASAVSIASAPGLWQLANLDGDGIPDLLLGGGAGGAVTVARGTGRASFGPPQPIPGILGFAAAPGDFDGDGADDVVDETYNSDGSNDVTVRLAAAGFAAGETLHFLPGDGFAGVVAFPLQPGRHWVLGIRYAQSVDLRAIGNLAGAVLSTIPYPALPADYDGDGNTDLVLRGVVALGDGRGTFQIDTSRSVGPFPLVAADLDGDGHLDLKQIDAASTSSQIFSLHGTGDGHFVAGPTVYVERFIEGVPPVPIHIAGRRGADLVVTAAGDVSAEFRILKGDCP